MDKDALHLLAKCLGLVITRTLGSTPFELCRLELKDKEIVATYMPIQPPTIYPHNCTTTIKVDKDVN